MTQPTNSIDSELEEILDESLREILNNICWREMLTIEEFDQAIAKIKALYRKEVEEAMNLFGRPVCEHLHHPKKYQHRSYEICPVVEHIVTLRAKLLPPTKGGNDE